MWCVDFPEWNIPCSPHLPHWDLKSPSLSGAHFLKVNLGPTGGKVVTMSGGDTWTSDKMPAW
jgi:hypothetical protein